MLHIKLPKGKVAEACERASDWHERHRDLLMDQYNAATRDWHKTHDIRKGRAMPPRPPRALLHSSSSIKELSDAAVMARRSTGDVYVSPTLWGKIKGVYDA